LTSGESTAAGLLAAEDPLPDQYRGAKITIRKRWRACQCFRTIHTAAAKIEGVEAMHMMNRGQLKRINGEDVVGHARFVESLFRKAA